MPYLDEKRKEGVGFKLVGPCSAKCQIRSIRNKEIRIRSNGPLSSWHVILFGCFFFGMFFSGSIESFCIQMYCKVRK